MKCKVVQRRLLSITDPGRVPADVRAHLARCGACREWQNQLVLLERHIPWLPVPASNGKAKLVRRLLRERVGARASESAPSRTRSDAPTLSHSHAPTVLRARALTLTVTAAVLLIAFGWWGLQSWLDTSSTLPPAGKPVADALLANLMQRDLRLATASTPRERVEILADVAEDLHGETSALAQAAAGEELAALATLYEQVVRQGILKQAQALPPAERRRTLDPISIRLVQTASAVEQLARELPDEFAGPLHLIAATAREAHRQLLALVPGGKA